MGKGKRKRIEREKLLYEPLIIDEFIQGVSVMKFTGKEKELVEEFLIEMCLYQSRLVKDINSGKLNVEDYVDMDRAKASKFPY